MGPRRLSDAPQTGKAPDKFATWLNIQLYPTLERAERDLAAARATMDEAGRRAMDDRPPAFVAALLALRQEAVRTYTPHGHAADT